MVCEDNFSDDCLIIYVQSKSISDLKELGDTSIENIGDITNPCK